LVYLVPPVTIYPILSKEEFLEMVRVVNKEMKRKNEREITPK